MKIKKLLLNQRVRESRLLGVEIGKDFIRLVVLSFNGKRYRLEVCENIHHKGLSDEFIVKIIKKSLKDRNIKVKFVAFSLSYADVVFKEVDVASNLSPKELDSFLRFHLSKDMNLAAEKIVFDHQIIEETKNIDRVKKLQLVAVERQHVEKKIGLFKKTRFCLKAIDVDIYAIERVIRHQLGDIDGLVGVIAIDREKIFILILDHKKIVCVREYFIDIDKLKVLAKIVEQIDLKLRSACLDLSWPLSRIIIAGEKGALFGLEQALSSQLNIPVEVANPFFNMEFSSGINLGVVKEISLMMLVSCGLALRVDGDGKY